MSETVLLHRFENGLTLLAEPMPWLESIALGVFLPGGYVYDPPGKSGLGNFTSEMVLRGCGERNSRQFVTDLNNLGVNYSSGVGGEMVTYRAAMTAETLPLVLPIYADLVQRPILPEDQLEDGRLVCVQEIRSFEDDPANLLYNELRRRTFPHPHGETHHGDIKSIESISASDIRAYYEKTYTPDSAIVSVAGKFDWDDLRQQIEKHFGAWQAAPAPTFDTSPPPAGHHHLHSATHQTHIGISFPVPAYAEPDYFLARGAIGVLSDGMSSRLFTEVREKRGLVYTVGASYDSIRERGAVLCYASSTTERAQETLNVMLSELHRLAEGIDQDELDRLKVQLKTGLVMQEESSRSRCGSIAADWRLLGRVRTREELFGILDSLSCEAINGWLADNPPCDFKIVTLGEEPLETHDAVS